MPGSYPERFKRLAAYDGRFDAYRLPAEGCEVLFASYPAGTSIPEHTHATDNFGIITRGELILRLGSVTQRYAVGQWYHVPAQTPHAAQFEVDTDEIEFWFEAGT